MPLVAAGVGMLASYTPGSSGETIQQLEATVPIDQSMGHVILSQPLEPSPITTIIIEKSKPESEAMTAPANSNADAREAAQELKPELETHGVKVDIHDSSLPGVDIVADDQEECIVQFNLVKNSPDSRKEIDVNLELYGARVIMDKILKNPSSAESGRLLYSNQVGHGDNSFPDAIRVDLDEPSELKAAAAKMSSIVTSVCVNLPKPHNS